MRRKIAGGNCVRTGVEAWDGGCGEGSRCGSEYRIRTGLSSREGMFGREVDRMKLLWPRKDIREKRVGGGVGF